MTYQIKHLTELSQCEVVFALYRRDSGTLGFMPKGAFLEGIRNRNLLIATDQTDTIIGYLLYRISNRKAAISHLCVNISSRGKGVAAALVNSLKEHTLNLHGITLKCRTDFNANTFWPRMGFAAKGKKIGRGADKAELTIWQIDHGHPDLFSVEPAKARVVIDANVFFDLGIPGPPQTETSMALLEPWVEDVVELSVTAEVYNDIERCSDEHTKHSSRIMAGSYPETRPPSIQVDRLIPELCALYPKSTLLNPRDESDIRHLASTIAANVKYFVTRDEGLLEKSAEILERFDVQIWTPVDLVSHLDWISRENLYQPVRLEGSTISKQRVDASMRTSIIASFRNSTEETISKFKALVEAFLSRPKERELTVSKSRGNHDLVLYGLTMASNGYLELPILRTTKDPLAATALLHHLMGLIREAAKMGANLLRVTETNLTPVAEQALGELGFRPTQGAWAKPLFSGFISHSEIEAKLNSLNLPPLHIRGNTVDETETYIWPAKLMDADMPHYLIPIRAEWAEHFFDTEEALKRIPGLSGIREELHLGVEAAYYTASTIDMRVPARILWYVSRGNEKRGSMEVKACSRLREVVRAGPKQLFKRFRRLGVYQWSDLYRQAGNNIESEVTALRFSHTERFEKPASPQMLTALGIKQPFMSPRLIPASVFIEIYNRSIRN